MLDLKCLMLLITFSLKSAVNPLLCCCRWSHHLFTLQPKCKIDESLPEFAIAIFTAYVRAMHEQVGRRRLPQQPVPLISCPVPCSTHTSAYMHALHVAALALIVC